VMNAWGSTRNIAVIVTVFVLTATAAIVEVHGGDAREIFVAAAIALLFYKIRRRRIRDDSIQEIIARINSANKGD